MKIFISWSGERSHQLAQALHHWLPPVLAYVQPRLSQADISTGERWAQEVAKELETSNFGIICVTQENLNSPWILFEAGALAKSLQGAKVIPLLLGLEFGDISGPLSQFQAKKLGKEGLWRSCSRSTSLPPRPSQKIASRIVLRACGPMSRSASKQFRRKPQARSAHGLSTKCSRNSLPPCAVSRDALPGSIRGVGFLP